MSQKHLFTISFTSVLFLLVSVLVYTFSQKNGFHIDEIYTYGLSNSYYEPFPFAKNQWVSGEYYQNYLSTTPETNFQYDSVYYNQTQDVHPPLYYFLVHTIASFLPGVFSKWIGLSLNLVIHLGIFMGIYAIVKKLTDNRWLALIGASFWAFSVGALSSASFIRMYHLLTLFQVALLYFSLKTVRTKEMPWKSLLGVGLVTYLGGLTQYYFYIYAFILVAIICIALLSTRKIKLMFQYGLSAVIGVAGAMLSFPAVFTHITQSDRGVEVLNGLDDELLTESNPFMGFIKEDLFRNIPVRYLVLFFGILAVVLLVAFFMKQKLKVNVPYLAMISVTLSPIIYTLIVQQVSHYQTPRYIYSIYPVITIAVLLLCYYGFLVISKQPQITTWLIGGATLGMIGTGLYVQTPDYLYQKNQPIQTLVNDIENQQALVLGDGYWTVSKVAAEVKDFDRVYPSIITNSLTNLPETIEGGELYVVMLPHPRQDVPKVIDSIASKYNMSIDNSLQISHDKVLFRLTSNSNN